MFYYMLALLCLKSWSKCLSAPLSPSPLEGSATRTSPGTPSASCAKPAIKLWQELASLPMRTTFTAWTATRLTWPRSATAARILSQVSATSASSALQCDICCVWSQGNYHFLQMLCFYKHHFLSFAADWLPSFPLCRVWPWHQCGELWGILLARVLLQLQEV